MKKLLILLLFSYSIANAQLPTWVYGNQVNIGGRDTSVNAGLKLFINGRTIGKYLKNSGWGVSSFGNIESADVPWGGGFTLYDVRYVRDQRFLDSIAAVRAAFNSINLDWNNITGKPSLLIAGNNLADVSNVATARNNLSVYSKSESDAAVGAKLNISDTANMLFNYRMQMNSLQNFKLNTADTSTMLTNYVRSGSLGGYVPTTRTINGYALSANISLSKTDVGLGNVPNTDATNPANISQSASYRFVTDTEKSTWNAKQNALGYTAENTANKGVANGYADLDANGKVPSSRIDFSQTGQTFVVASQSAMLAVSGANVGAMAIRTDQSRTYVLIATPASTLANWVQLLSPDAPVQSVNGQTGNVNLLTTNIGEGTNLYYTNARARAALSAGTGISYNNTTGQISSTITQYTDALARASLSFAAGSGGYNSSTGVITIPTNTNQLTNGAGFITGITSGMVTTALGYTPYNASNPNNYLSSVSLTSNVTGVLPVANGGTGQTTIGGIQTALGLGSYAYRSSGLAELSGATFTGALNGTSGNFSGTVTGGGGLQTGSSANLSFGANKWMTQFEGSNITRTYFMGADASTYGIWEGYSATSTGSPSRVFTFSNGSVNFNASLTAGSTSVSGLTVGSAGAATIAAGANNLLVQTSAYTQLFRRDGVAGIYLGGISDQSSYYDNGGHVFRSANGATEWLTINSGGITTSRAIAGTSATFSSSVTASGGFEIPNGQFYRARRASGNLLINLLGIESGTDRTLMTITGDYVIQNGSASALLTMNTSGDASISGNLTLPNGVFYRARRTSGSSVVNVLGFESGTDNLAMTISDNLFIKNTGASTIYTLTWQGAATYAAGVTATSYTESSDIRQKLVHTTLTAADGIDAIHYTFKPDGQLKWGYSAQQVQKVLPMAVHEGIDGFLKLDYTTVHTYKIAQLEKRVADLEKQASLTEWLTDKVLQLQLQVINLQFPQKSKRK